MIFCWYDSAFSVPMPSDILKLREIVRQNFLMYYTQENLLELRSRQIAENRIFDNVEAFGQVFDQ